MLTAPLRLLFAEPVEETHPDDLQKQMEEEYERRFGEPWSALEERVLERHPEFRRFK